MEAMFDILPDELKEQIYTNIMYPKPDELLKEIRMRGIAKNMLSILNILDTLPLCDILNIYNHYRKKVLNPNVALIIIISDIDDMPKKQKKMIFKIMRERIKTGA